jgi:hypothetical protein
MIGGCRDSPYALSYRLAEYFPVFSWASAQQTPSARISHMNYYTAIDAVSVKDVPLERRIDTSHPIGSYPSKIPHFRDVSGDFQLKRLRAYLNPEETDHNA